MELLGRTQPIGSKTRTRLVKYPENKQSAVDLGEFLDGERYLKPILCGT